MRFLATLALLFVAASPLHASSLIGDSLTCNASAGFIINCGNLGGTVPVGPGVEYTVTYTSGHTLALDFTDTGLTLTDNEAFNVGFSSSYGPGIFLRFTDVTNAFTSESFLSASTPITGTGFVAGDASLANGVLSLNLNGVTFFGGNSVSLGLTTATPTVAATPEPETLALVGPALLGIAMLRRKLGAKK